MQNGGGDATFRDKRWRRRHFLRQKAASPPPFVSKSGGEVREGGRCENVQGGEQAMRAASGWQHLGSQHSRWQQSRWQRPGSSVRVAASGWKRAGERHGSSAKGGGATWGG